MWRWTSMGCSRMPSPRRLEEVAPRARRSSSCTASRTTTTRPGSRRPWSDATAILEIARRADLLVVEDNPYGLLGFDGEPTPAMRSLEEDRVIYLGSFSKTFAPGFRVGLGPRSARCTGEAGAGPGVGDALPPRSPSTRSRPIWPTTTGVARSRSSARCIGSGGTPCWRVGGRHAAWNELDRCPPAGSSSGSRCRRGWTRTPCSLEPSPHGWPTCRAPPSTPTASAAGTCGCPTAIPPRAHP